MKVLPAGWSEAPLGSIAEVRLGRQRSPKNHAGDNMKPYLRAANVNWDGLDLSDVNEMNFSTGEVDTYRLEPGDVLIAEASGSQSQVGKPAIWRGEIADCCFQNTLLRVRSSALVPEYLRYFVLGEALSSRLGQAARGVGIHHLGAAGLSSYLTPLAPIAEQRRIVAAIEEQFSRLDAAERYLSSARLRLDVLRPRMVTEAFAGDWEWVTLGDIAEIVGGVTKDSKRQSDPSFIEVPYLRVANVQRGFLDLRDVSAIRVPPDKARALELKPGDVLFNEGGDRDKLGRGWVWAGEVPDCIHQNHVFRARLRDGFDPYFVSFHGNSFGQRWFVDNGRQTTNLASVSMSTLKTFPVPAPPIKVQREIVSSLRERLSTVDALSSDLDDAVGRSRALRQAVLQQAFAGQLVPQDSNDEPSAVLIEQIAAGRETRPRTRGRKAEVG